MKYLFIISFCGLSWFSHGQTILSGKVLNEQGGPVGFATVSVENLETKAVIAYDLLDELGVFSIALKTDLKEVNVRVSALNYRVLNTVVATKTQELLLKIESEVTELEEIVVKASVITQQNDTIVFDLNAFAGKNDRVLEDVLKKMPGIEVGIGGEIKYQGKTINKFYVEGKDLMGGKYSTITQALPNMHVSKLEVLENHQPIKMLEDKVGSDSPAINIRLKKNVSFSGSGKLGVGAEPLLWKADVTPMLFTKELQYAFSYKTNNTGQSLGGSLDGFGSYGSFDILNYWKTFGNQLRIAETPIPNIDNSRYLFNTSHYTSGNTVFNLNKDLELRINFYYYNSEVERTGEQYTEIRNGLTDSANGEIIRYGRKNESVWFTEKLNSQFTFTRNNKENYLKDVFSFSLNRQKARGVLAIDEDPLTQMTQSPSYYLQNTLSTLIPLKNDKFINFRSIVNLNRDKQNYTVSPTQFLNTPNDFTAPYTALDQLYVDNTFYTQNAFSLSWNLRKWTLTEEYSILYENSAIDTDLYGQDTVRESVGKRYINDLKYNRLENAAKTSFNYKGIKWDFNINLPIQWKVFDLKDKVEDIKNTKNALTFEPSIGTTYRATSRWTFRGGARTSTHFTPLSQLFPNYVFSSLDFSAYQSKIESSRTYSSNLNMEYKNPFNGIFINGGASVSSSENKLLYGSKIDENGQQIIDAIERDNTSVSQSANLNIGKFISDWSTNVKGSFTFAKNKNESLINESLRDISMYNFGYGLEITNNHYDWMNLTYKANYGQSQRLDDALKTNSYSHSQNVRIDAFPIKNHSITWWLDYRENTFDHQTFSNRFMDVMYRYKWDKKKIDFEIEWQNILNTKEYEEVIINSIQTSTTKFKLRPVQILFSVRFNF